MIDVCFIPESGHFGEEHKRSVNDPKAEIGRGAEKKGLSALFLSNKYEVAAIASSSAR
jgi:hypothetical protein